MACYMSLSLILALYILWLTSPHKYIRESRPLSLAHTKASAVSAMRDVELSLVLLGKQDLLGKHFVRSLLNLIGFGPPNSYNI